MHHSAEGCIAFLPCIEVLNTGVGQIDSCFELLQCAHFYRLGVLMHCTGVVSLVQMCATVLSTVYMQDAILQCDSFLSRVCL